MLNEAIKKIKDEMDKNNNPYIKVVGEFLLQHLNVNPDSSEKILDKEKSIIKSLDEMRKAAEKKKIGNCALLTDEEGFEIVLKYFGIKASAKTIENPVKETIIKTEPKEHKGIDFDVKLDDLLV